jgi:hypothetical protein
MNLKKSFKLLAVRAAGIGLVAGVVVLATLGITLSTMITAVTVGVVFELTLPYKPIMVTAASITLAVLTVLSVKHLASK